MNLAYNPHHWQQPTTRTRSRRRRRAKVVSKSSNTHTHTHTSTIKHVQREKKTCLESENLARRNSPKELASATYMEAMNALCHIGLLLLLHYISWFVNLKPKPQTTFQTQILHGNKMFTYIYLHYVANFEVLCRFDIYTSVKISIFRQPCLMYRETMQSLTGN